MKSSVGNPLIALAVWSLCTTGAGANPTGPTVVNGQVTVNQAGNLLSVTNSPNAIINWQSFSIGANEITRFTQQSAASAVLNRVVGAGGSVSPSTILGAMQSNGRVFLINPSGIVFGASAQIDVAGLVASSLNLSDPDFLGGRLRFTAVPGAGSVVNNGAINAASGGQVYLLGPSVTNGGIITAPQGEAILAAGNSVELVNPSTPNLRVEISAPDNEALNLGQILASSGRIGIYTGLIKSTGTLNADRAVTGPAGEILLKAATNVVVEGPLTAVEGSISIGAGGRVFIRGGTQPGTLTAGTVSIDAGESLFVDAGGSIQGTSVINITGTVCQSVAGSTCVGTAPTLAVSGQDVLTVVGPQAGAGLTITPGRGQAGSISLGEGGNIVANPGSGGSVRIGRQDGNLSENAPVATTLAAGNITAGNITSAGGITRNAGIIVTESGGLTFVGQNSQVTLTRDQVSSLTFNNLSVGTGSIVVNAGNTLTLVGQNGQVTLGADQVRTVSVNNLAVPVSTLFGLGSFTLRGTTNLLTLLPAGQVMNRGTAQVTSNVSTISQVNDVTKNIGGAARHILTPPRTNLVFE